MRVLLLSVAFPFVVATGGARVASAQAPASPPTPTGGVFGPQGDQSASDAPRLSLTLNLGGGYDETPDAVNGDSNLPLFDQGGVLSAAAGTLAFRKGSVRRLFQANAAGYVNRASQGLDQVEGGEANMDWQHSVGPRAGANVSLIARSQPATLFSAYAPVEGQVGGLAPSAGPSQGVARQQWFNAEGGVGVYRNLTPRQRADVKYDASTRSPMSGPGVRSHSQALTYLHTWAPRPRLTILPTYRLTASQQRDEFGNDLPLTVHAGLATVTWTKGAPGGRTITLSGGGGMTHSRYRVADRLFTFNVPSYTGSLRTQLRSGWRFSLDGARDVSVLEGLSPEPFATHAVLARSEGLIGRRFYVVAGASHSFGGALVTNNGEFESQTGTVQLQYALGRSWAVYSSYAYYRYRLRDVRTVGAFPSSYTLNSVRVGLNVWLPLHGRQ